MKKLLLVICIGFGSLSKGQTIQGIITQGYQEIGPITKYKKYDTVMGIICFYSVAEKLSAQPQIRYGYKVDSIWYEWIEVETPVKNNIMLAIYTQEYKKFRQVIMVKPLDEDPLNIKKQYEFYSFKELQNR